MLLHYRYLSMWDTTTPRDIHIKWTVCPFLCTVQRICLHQTNCYTCLPAQLELQGLREQCLQTFSWYFLSPTLHRIYVYQQVIYYCSFLIILFRLMPSSVLGLLPNRQGYTIITRIPGVLIRMEVCLYLHP